MTGGARLEISKLRVEFPVQRELREIAAGAARRRVVALDGVSLAVEPGEILGVVGESGSGKSTLARAIVGLVGAVDGSIRFGDEELLGKTGGQASAARRRIQMVFQDPYASLNPRLSVGRAVSEPARVRRTVDRQSAEAFALELLGRVGVEAELVTRRPRALSGGQRQRVAIARALAAGPDLLIADEAVSALDVSIQAQILNLFMDLQRDLGVSMIFISHDLGVVAHVADRVAIMYLGRIVESGPTSEVFDRPAHPYTRGLLAARPGRHRRNAVRKPALAGEIPSALALPTGCRFRTRCPVAMDICAEIDPDSIAVSDTHLAACHRVGEYGGPPSNLAGVAAPDA